MSVRVELARSVIAVIAITGVLFLGYTYPKEYSQVASLAVGTVLGGYYGVSVSQKSE